MSWKWFVPFVLAAIFTGRAVDAPQIQEPIPRVNDEKCEYDEALRNFYLGYAYARERPELARKFLAAAEAERLGCRSDTSLLRARIRELSLGIDSQGQ